MIHSAATKYALRAVCYMAELPEDTWAQAREISEALGIPHHYLAKILQDLTRKRILKSSKGPGGGFQLNCYPAETSLLQLIEAVEGPYDDNECMLGFEICSESTMCPMHHIWKECRVAFREKTEAISLLDVVEATQRKRGMPVTIGTVGVR